jgi:methionyl-tRNA formyltransferase
MRIIFMGSGELGCPALARLLEAADHEVVGVVSQPDRPKGRRLRLGPCPAKAVADARGVPVFTPESVNAAACLETLGALAPDVVVVAAYGQKLGAGLLALPRRGCINIHASLLPRYRGAAPIQWAIANGDSLSGVTLMHMNDRMDAGDIIARVEVAIEPDDTAGSLHDRLAVAGAGLLMDVLAAVAEGRAARMPQDESQATFAPKLTKSDGRIDWALPARQIVDRVRGFNPWPCCFCLVGETGKRLRVLRAETAAGTGRPGTVLEVEPDLVVAAGAGAVRLREVQPEGRNVMSAAAYRRGHGLATGERIQ